MAELLQLEQLTDGMENLCMIHQHILTHGVSTPLLDLVGDQLRLFCPGLENQTEATTDQKSTMLQRVINAIKLIYQKIIAFIKRIVTRVREWMQSNSKAKAEEKAANIKQVMAAKSPQAIAEIKNEPVTVINLTGAEYLMFIGELDDISYNVSVLASKFYYPLYEDKMLGQSVVDKIEKLRENIDMLFERIEYRRQMNRTVLIKDFTDGKFLEAVDIFYTNKQLNKDLEMAELVGKKCAYLEDNLTVHHQFDIDDVRLTAKASELLAAICGKLISKRTQFANEYNKILNDISATVSHHE